MNVPPEVAQSVIRALRGEPFLLALLILNIIVLLGFGYALHEVANAMQRRETILERCFK